MTASPRGPLAGRRILVTRPPERARGLVDRLVAAGGRVEVRPAIAFEHPADRAAARAAVLGIERYDWVVFTSATGVRFFDAGLREAGLGPSAVRARVAVVGPATAREANQAALRPDLVATRERAEGLAEALVERVDGQTRVLWVRPEQARPVLEQQLAQAGARVDAIAFYRTLPAPGVEGVAHDLCRGRFDAVIFSSPSAFRVLLETAGERLRQALGAVRVVAIGEVTAAAIRAAGCRADAIAARPTDEAVGAAVEALFAR